MELLLKTFSFSEEEFEFHNTKSTSHVKSYHDNTMDKTFKFLFNYLDNLDHNLTEYCAFGADKCIISNFQEFCNNLNIDIVENLSRIITEHYYIFEKKYMILKYPESFYNSLQGKECFHFYNKDKTFMFSCTSPLFIKGSLGYFGCTGNRSDMFKAFEMIYNNGNYDLSYGGRDYV